MFIKRFKFVSSFLAFFLSFSSLTGGQDLERGFLEGTEKLEVNFKSSDSMLRSANLFIDELIVKTVTERNEKSISDYKNEENFFSEVLKPKREKLKEKLGLDEVDIEKYNVGRHIEEEETPVLNFISPNSSSGVLYENEKYQIFGVSWEIEGGIKALGLLGKPKEKIKGHIICIPDANQLPESLLGIERSIGSESQFARRLLENGFQVIVPVILDRKDFKIEGDAGNYSINNREWIYRQAFPLGKTLTGFEVQKVLELVSWIKCIYGDKANIGVAGYGEGGRLALLSGALDPKIKSVWVSGYYNKRINTWREPIDRNIFGMLSDFGDAELASLIIPRSLVIENSFIIDSFGFKMFPDINKSNYSGFKGWIEPIDDKSFLEEVRRLEELSNNGNRFNDLSYFIMGKDSTASFGRKRSLEKFCEDLINEEVELTLSHVVPRDPKYRFDYGLRQFKQTKEIEDYCQKLLNVSDQMRDDFFLLKATKKVDGFGSKDWSTKRYHPYTDPSDFILQSEKFRKEFWENVLGKISEEKADLHPRSIKVIESERWTGYKVIINVYKDFFASGIILIPKDLVGNNHQKRPVIVLQHGRNGTPFETIEGNYEGYGNIGSKFADRGYVVFAPQGLFWGEDRYRWLNKKCNTIGLTLFSLIISQHEQILKWLNSLSFVDGKRIGFVGQSYGGETALRVPSILKGYCLSVVSGDFGDWSRKLSDTYNWHSFMNKNEWEMPYFRISTTFSYAEMAYLIFPRPFIVERGHFDKVQPDKWVMSEYGKVKRLYTQFGMKEDTKINFMNGGHSMEGSNYLFSQLSHFFKWP